jgi:hypothetical protein
MRTQIDINDALHTRVKTHCASAGITLKAFTNEAFSDLLKRKQAKTGNPLRIRKGERV